MIVKYKINYIMNFTKFDFSCIPDNQELLVYYMFLERSRLQAVVENL